MKILKLAVTKSSTLVAPPASSGASASSSVTYHWEAATGSNFAETDMYCKKELPGRTMEFTFDLSQTPLIGRRTHFPSSSVRSKSSSSTVATSNAAASAASTVTASTLAGLSSLGSSDDRDYSNNFSLSRSGRQLRDLYGNDSTAGNGNNGSNNTCVSPRRSFSLSTAETAALSGWKRPWMSQAAVRERLVNLLNSCGQRVGLPKSPSVIFSQNSELLERQSSMPRLLRRCRPTTT